MKANEAGTQWKGPEAGAEAKAVEKCGLLLAPHNLFCRFLFIVVVGFLFGFETRSLYVTLAVPELTDIRVPLPPEYWD